MLNPLKIASIIGNRLVLWALCAKFEEQIASGVQVIGCCWISKVTGDHGTHSHVLIKNKNYQAEGTLLMGRQPFQQEAHPMDPRNKPSSLRGYRHLTRVSQAYTQTPALLSTNRSRQQAEEIPTHRARLAVVQGEEHVGALSQLCHCHSGL